jgi:hypothetical protein
MSTQRCGHQFQGRDKLPEICISAQVAEPPAKAVGEKKKALGAACQTKGPYQKLTPTTVHAPTSQSVSAKRLNHFDLASW